VIDGPEFGVYGPFMSRGRPGSRRSDRGLGFLFEPCSAARSGTPARQSRRGVALGRLSVGSSDRSGLVL